MNNSVSNRDLLETAIAIERNGIAFYDVMSRSAENDEVRDIFQFLSNMEHQHVQIFEGILNETNKHGDSKINSGEYGEYISSLRENALFSEEMITSEAATNISSDLGALELAIGMEKDSILFYYEMREVLPKQTHPTINQVIKEEKSHLWQLSELKKRLSI